MLRSTSSQVLATADCELDDVVDCQVWLSDASDFVEFNTIVQQYFAKDPPVLPSPRFRKVSEHVGGVGASLNVNVEMRCDAHTPWPEGGQQHSPLPGAVDDDCRDRSRRHRTKSNDVCLNRLQIDLDSRQFGYPLGEQRALA